MTAVLRLLLAVIWLIFGVTATANATPQPDCAMTGMKHHHSRPGDAAPAAMPCCSQPALVASPATACPVERASTYVRLTPAPVPLLTGTILVLEPRPPKVI